MNGKFRIILHIFLLVTFLAGIYVILTNGLVNNTTDSAVENMDNKDNASASSCPDLLIKQGNSLFLYNTTAPIVDGQNPIPFYNLDEYINYLEVQRKKGIHCPVLYLQQENDVQGKTVYRMQPSPFYVEGGLPALPMQTIDNTKVQMVMDASRDNSPYNANNYPGFDPYGQDIGINTNIDLIHKSTEMENSGISDNPMDTNWGGVEVTQQSVDSGKFVGNEVVKAIYPNVIPK
jgi:hypothetical protein